jgi:UDP-2-acetamido-2,6-beta-L-arabino-hexul-4-ose reductase
MNVLVTGSNGFIAKNLIVHLQSKNSYKVIKLKKNYSTYDLKKKILDSDIIFHLAGVNRANNSKQFFYNNYILTKKICSIIKSSKKKIKIIFSSSIQAKKNNFYGNSKIKSEKEILKLKKFKNINILIYRLPNVFGKWAKPFYNSVVATFSYQVSRNKKINIFSNKELKLLYIDDLIKDFLKIIQIKRFLKSYRVIKNIQKIRLNKLASIIQSFNSSENVLFKKKSNNLIANLYSTYLSYIPKKLVSYDIDKFEDHRGKFIEFIKCDNFGQISFFTIFPKKVRGNHYHHSKTEKFLVINGIVKFNFINIITKKKYSIIVNEKKEKVVITQPGWAHNLVNIGKKTAKIIVWSNEVFNKYNPDTIIYKLQK